MRGIMPYSDDEERLHRFEDRDLLIGVSKDVISFSKEIAEMRADILGRFRDLEMRMDQRFNKIEGTQERLELRIDKVEQRQDIAAGGLGFGRWLLATVIALPFLGILIGAWGAN